MPRDWRQSGYEIEAYRADGQLSASTGQVESGDSVLVPWPFVPLASREQLFVRVRVWGQDNEASSWSELVSVEAGLLQPTDWTASFVTPDWAETRVGLSLLRCFAESSWFAPVWLERACT
jgi:alpha-L-rhamnosidase